MCAHRAVAVGSRLDLLYQGYSSVYGLFWQNEASRHVGSRWGRRCVLCIPPALERVTVFNRRQAYGEVVLPKIIFINRFFYPDHSATSQMLTDIAFGLAEKGWRVTVITSRLSYQGSGGALPPRETIRNVAILRIWTSSFGRDHLVGRAIDYATFYLSTALL